MVAGLFPTADVDVHTGFGKSAREVRAEQQVIDPDAVVAAERVAEVIPERVDGLLGVQGAE